jgi:prepilin-type N-terminal cleavage/methylation domain-containing protein
MNQQQNINRPEAGFSLLELLIAMSVTIAFLAIGTTVMSSLFNIRTREHSVSDASADVQRALSIMSREIANAGFRLTTNGVVPGDSDSSHIRVRSNLNKFDPSATQQSRDNVVDPGEDIKYFVNVAGNTDYLVRYDVNAPPESQKTVLANRLDSLRIHYFGQRVTYTTNACDISAPSSGEVDPASARYVVIAVCVLLPAVGTPASAGYQPASRVLLVSDVTLRNANLITY